jgi:leader peptidase (prepilin peptidase) / N-methyltransferase
MDAARASETVVLDGYTRHEADGSERVRLLRHPIPVAILSAAFAALALICHPLGADAVIAAIMAASLIVAAASDIERRIIPNRIVLPATAIVLLVRVVFFPEVAPEFIIAAVGAGIPFLIPSLINPALMGMGDVKLVVLLGAGLGRGVVGALMVAFISLLPVALGTLVRGGLGARKATLPFGPFLALGGLAVLIVPHL